MTDVINALNRKCECAKQTSSRYWQVHMHKWTRSKTYARTPSHASASLHGHLDFVSVNTSQNFSNLDYKLRLTLSVAQWLFVRRACLCWQVWDLKDLGLQATQRIVNAADPLRMLIEVSQNFPSLAGSLSRIAIPDDVRAETRAASQPFAGMLFAPNLLGCSMLGFIGSLHHNAKVSVYMTCTILPCIAICGATLLAQLCLACHELQLISELSIKQ